jgi:gliding motility-associated-like protein
MISKIHTTFLKAFYICLTSLLFAVTGYAQPCQTIVASVTSTSPAANPVDSMIKICKGTTVSFTGSATFSSSSAGATYQWRFNDGTVIAGTTASKNFPDEGVYVVDFVAIDAAGCVNKNCDSRRVIQVSTTPVFANIIRPDTVCLHQPATIQGIVTPVDGVYDCAPPISDTTYLPDGTGVSYTTTIDVTCFTPCDTVAAATDIESICMNIEHSFVGDLIVSIECPNGQTALLFDGNPGGGTYLGTPNDVDGFTNPYNGPADNEPGIGATYCFSPTAALGTLVAAPLNTAVVTNTSSFGITTTGASILAGTYLPQAGYGGLIGCPLNGDWTIHITDDAGADNGFIFNWGINFSQSLGSYSFTPTYPQQHWAPNQDIVSTSNGGKDIVIRPETGEGLHCYTFSVVDGFNCPYDTTICVYVVDPGNPGADTTVKLCLNQDAVNAFDYLGGNPTPGGTWTGTGVTNAGIFDPAANGVGDHPITYTQREWNCDTSATIIFKVVNDVVMDFSYDLAPACDQDTIRFTNLSEAGSYWWNFADGSTPDDTTVNPTHIYQNQNEYGVRLTVKNLDGCIDSIIKFVDTRHPLISAFTMSDDSLCQTDGTPVEFTDVSTGYRAGWHWDFGDGGTSTAQNPTHVYTLAGTHQVRLVINDTIVCYDTAFKNIYVDSLPFIHLVTDKHAICEGDEVNYTLDYLHPALSVNWDFGDGVHWMQTEGTTHSYDKAGTYWVTATASYPVCDAAVIRDSIVVSGYPVVYLGPDSVMCLDGPSITLADLNNNGNPAVKWVWSTGATTSSIKVVHPGIYSITATEKDCSTTDQVVVNKDCYTDIPNAFTPNGDGENDYFYPRQLLAKGVTGFTMTVFNRWGQKVFETGNSDGRGWDGKFNEKEQPVGVYIYQIHVIMKNGRTEDYNGNVTLIR